MSETTIYPHLDVGTRALVAAFEGRLAPGVGTWTDLFTADAVLEAKFDEGAQPYSGRQALLTLAHALAHVIRFEEVQIHEVIDAADGHTVTYTSAATFTRSDLQARLRRSYVSIARLDGGRIAHLREYGGPLRPAPQ